MYATYYRSILNKWSVAIQKVQDSPHSEEHELMVERATHAFRIQNGDKPFKLEHCWAILCKDAKFTQMPRPTINTKDAGIHSTPTGSSLASSTQHAQETPHELNTVAIEEEAPEYSIPLFNREVGSRDNSVEIKRREKHVGARPIGRKTTKELRRAKRQASSEAQNAIGEKVTIKLDELQTASSVGWQSATELHEDKVRCSIHAKRLQTIRDKMTFEKEMIIVENQLYEFDGSVFESPSDIYKVAAGRKSRLAAL